MFPTHSSIVPVRLMWSSDSWIKALNFPILGGTIPDRLFPPISRRVRLVDRFAIEFGMDPCSLLLASESFERDLQFPRAWRNSQPSLYVDDWSMFRSRFRTCNCERFPIELGICPVKWLPERSRVSRPLGFPREAGIWPSKLFSPKNRMLRFGRASPILDGNELPSILDVKDNFWREDTLDIYA